MQHGSFNLAKPGCVVYTMRHNDRWCYRSLLLGGAQQHFDTLHGIVPGIFIVRLAPLRQPLCTFYSQLCRHRDIVTAKQDIESYLLFVFPKSMLMVLLRSAPFLSQLVFNNE